jgi:hypothetical protein
MVSSFKLTAHRATVKARGSHQKYPSFNGLII